MGPLAGKKIIEFAGLGPAPVCGMMLADMGAEVILVDRPAENDGTAAMNVERSRAFMNRGKKSIAIDLKAAGAAGLVLDLLRDADGLIEGFRPGVMERLGLGPDACLEVNPRLVYGRLTGWGQTGPLSQVAGHDINYVAISGAAWYSSRPPAPPLPQPTQVGDMCGGTMNLTIGMLAAMLHAQASGRGQVVDAAISDGAALSTTMLYALYGSGLWSSQRGVNLLDGGAHWYDCYECADGRYVSVGSLEPKFYAQLLQALGLEGDADMARQYDRAQWPAMKQRFAAIFREKTRQEWCDLLEGSDVCFAPVLDFDEAPAHPHNRARGTFIEVDGVTQPAPAPRFSESAATVRAAPPRVGQDADEILAAAGFSAAERAALRERGLV